MDALKNRLADLAHQAEVDAHDLVDSSRAVGTQMRRRRRLTIGAATLAAVAVVGGTAVGGAVLLAPDASEPDSALVATQGPIVGLEIPEPDGTHPLAEPPFPFVRDEATSGVTLPPGAPDEVKLDGRTASAIALTALGELFPGRFAVDPHGISGSGEGEEVKDDGVVTGPGKLVEISSQISLIDDGVPVRLSILAQQRQRAPEDVDCSWPKGQDDCEIVPQSDGSKMMVYTSHQLIDPERPELNTTGITVDHYDPATGLRLRVGTSPETLGVPTTTFTREEMIALTTVDDWAPAVPIEWYLRGQEFSFLWSPSNEYDVLPEEREGNR